MLCFSIVLWLRWLEKSGPKNGRVRRICGPRCDKICTTPARESDLEVKSVKSWQPRSTFGSWSPGNLHHACARERFGSQNRKKLRVREHFWKLKSAKFAPRLRASTIWKSKSLKHQVLGPLFEVQNAFRVAGAGILIRFKMRGRRRSSWGLQKRWQAWGIWRGSETMRFAWQGQGFRALRCQCLKPQTQNPWKGCNFHVTEVLLCSDHFAWQLQDFVCLGSTFSWQPQYFWSIHLKIVKTYWNPEVKCPVNMSFLKEVSHKSFVFDLQSFIFEGSLAQKLRFWASKLHFWRKSRRNASFLIFKASFLKEVSHKSFVFALQSFIFEGISSFFDLQSFVFEGSLAQKLRFWAWKLHFWRKSRRNVSFLIFKASFLKEVSQNSFSQSVSQSVSQINQSVSQWVSQSVSQSVR